MAVLSALPEQSIIDGYRGVLDFYYYCGLPVARSWPRSPGKTRAPKVVAAAAQFDWVQKSTTALPADIKYAWMALPQGQSLTWRDWATRLTISGAKYCQEWQE